MAAGALREYVAVSRLHLRRLDKSTRHMNNPWAKRPINRVFRHVRLRAFASDGQVSAIRLSTLGKKLDMIKFPGGQIAPGELRRVFACQR